MEKKICFRCGIEKDLSHYYKHKGMADGHLNKCKDCAKSYSKKRDLKIRSTPEGREKERERHRLKYHRLNYKETQLKWNEKRPWTKSGLYKSLNKKLKGKGILNHDEVAHHWNYGDAFLQDVFILKHSHHRLIHKHLIMKNDVRLFSYNGSLLLTKEMHLRVIQSIAKIEGIENFCVRQFKI